MLLTHSLKSSYSLLSKLSITPSIPPTITSSHYNTKQFSSKPPLSSPIIFNRKLKSIHRNRQALLYNNQSKYDILRSTTSERIIDRLHDIKKKFNNIAELGVGNGYVLRSLVKNPIEIKEYTAIESSEKLLNIAKEIKVPFKINYINIDEELYNDEPNSKDLIISNLNMHWINDLPGLFKNVHATLKKDGVFIGALYGGSTLQELRSAFALSDMERLGGLASHVSPFTHIGDIGNLLISTGFNMTTVDAETFDVAFPDAFVLMEFLKGMGETAADESHFKASKDSLLSMASIYDGMYQENGFVKATFQVFYFIGWKPDESQPKPMKRGSANTHLGDIEDVISEIQNNEVDPSKK